MIPQEVRSKYGVIRSPKDVEPGMIANQSYADGKHVFTDLTLKGLPVDKSKTGSSRATKYIYALNLGDWYTHVSLSATVVFYASTFLHQETSKASVIVTNFTGTCFLLTVLGAFIADSFLGHYFTILVGAVIETIGIGLLVLSASYSGLQPPACTPSLTSACPPAGGKYTGTLYVALYTYAFGTGFIKAAISAFGAEQFDENDEKEREKSTHFFQWLFLAQLFGEIVSFTLSVYLLNYVSKSWAFGSMLIGFPVTLLIFVAGTPKYRHKRPAGSFITRIAQVAVAVLRNRKLKFPEDSSLLHDEPVVGEWLRKTNQFRLLDKASIVGPNEGAKNSKWKLVGVTQVEETKRMIRLLPVWVTTWMLSLQFAQVTTFTATQAATLDRKLSKHFEVPAATMAGALVLFNIILIPIYEKIVRPALTKVTKNPYGITPLKRVGISAIAATLTMISAALVEKKRLRYIRRLGYTQATTFELPMKVWWLLPQYFFSGLTEMFLNVPLYELFYHEVSDATRSIGTSFLFSALAMGYYFGSVIVNVTNSVTKHKDGGSWLTERLNNGGLESYFWLLAVLLAVNFLFFLITSSMYNYNYLIYRGDKTRAAHANANTLPPEEADES